MSLEYRLSCLAVLIALTAGAPSAARADHAPSIVVPGRSDVPVIIDGVDATWSVVYGDWGLYRAGHRGVTIESGPLLTVVAPTYGYYPATGRPPRYGRHEIVPRRAGRAPRPAESYHRSWSASSFGRTQVRPFFDDDLPPDPPPVIPAPRLK